MSNWRSFFIHFKSFEHVDREVLTVYVITSWTFTLFRLLSDVVDGVSNLAERVQVAPNQQV